MTADPIRVALIGLGGMGSAHLEVLADLPQATIVALADSHAPFVDRAAASTPGATVFYDPIDCVNNTDVDAAIIATGDDTHFGITQACIARGLPVLCEKPLTTTAHESRQIVAAEQATGRPLVQVGWMRRFDTDYRALHSQLRAATDSTPVLITQRHRNPLSVIKFDERELITSSASHDIDIFRWLTGDDIAEVNATSTTSSDGNTVLVVLTMTSQTGVVGAMELVRGPGLSYDIGCDIITSTGPLTLTATEPDPADLLHPGAEAWMQRFAQAYRGQDAAWLGAIAHGANVVGATAADGYAVNTVIDAALASLASGHAEKPTCN
jgi:myo-inositol 2-dehydrogenase/D-chiro-inositol 1-dehydrogenase